MKKTGKFTTIILALVMVLTLIPMTGFIVNAKGDTFSTISIGGYHCLAIKSDRSLWAWGLNEYGQLGDGTTKNKSTPVKIMDGVTAVSAGNSHSLAIKSDGSLWAWGLNDIGELGDGTTTDKSTPVKIMDGVAAISAGSSHSLAIKSDGSLWAWGWNGAGELGDGTTKNKSTPVKIMDGVTTVSAEVGNSFIIKSDGSLWAWGDNYYGQLGDGTHGYGTEKVTPVKIMDGVTSVSAGIDYCLAIKNDSSLWAWGYNYQGQLGDGTTTNKANPVKIMDGATAVSAGYVHSLAIKSDGSLWAWGRNWVGQLGDGTTEDKSTPVKIMDGIMMPGVGTTSPSAKTTIPAPTQPIAQPTAKASWMNETLDNGQLVYSPMANGKIGGKGYHEMGWDFIASKDEPIYAVEDCEVVYYILFGYTTVNDKKVWHYADYGNWAIAKGEHTEVKYAHMNGYPTDVNGVNMQVNFENWLKNAKNKTFTASGGGSFVFDGTGFAENNPKGPFVAPEKKTSWDYPNIEIGRIKVKKGDLIGYVGNTGGSDTPHLHVEFKYDGKSLMLNQIRFPNNQEVSKSGDKWTYISSNSAQSTHKTGDTLGNVLYSDITAYINGNAIPTSVINGKTLIVVEDLANYGFDVKWISYDKSLRVELNKDKKVTPLPVKKNTNPVGAVKGKYYFTDIKTYLSGDIIESYAVEGVTLIDFELLAKYGSLTWDGKAREIRLVLK